MQKYIIVEKQKHEFNFSKERFLIGGNVFDFKNAHEIKNKIEKMSGVNLLFKVIKSPLRPDGSIDFS